MNCLNLHAVSPVEADSINQALTPLLATGIMSRVYNSLQLLTTAKSVSKDSVAVKPTQQLLQFLHHLFSSSSIAVAMLRDKSSEANGLQVFEMTTAL